MAPLSKPLSKPRTKPPSKQQSYIVQLIKQMLKRWLEMIVVGALVFNGWMMYTKAWDGTVGVSMIGAIASFYGTMLSAKKNIKID